MLIWSVFVRQSGSFCAFANASSWVILSDIEQRIKEKIERIGRPLRDWDVQINYGIKTGFNEAFIIDGEKRKELIAQDPKSEEIIRPILRGRDIKRYGYEYADLHLIATFPSLKLDIEKYPAVKKHLLSFGMQRLEQSGKEYKLNGETVKARKKTKNKWFETQDSISYWEDFNRQKIIWIELADKGRFAIDNKDNYITLNGTFIMIGNDLEYIACILNNPITSWHFNTYCISSGVGTNQWREHYVKELFIPDIPKKEQIPLINQVNKILELRKRNKSTGEEEKKLDQMVYTILQLDSEQINFIESQ